MAFEGPRRGGTEGKTNEKEGLWREDEGGTGEPARIGA